jgi:hypothetical protein
LKYQIQEDFIFSINKRLLDVSDTNLFLLQRFINLVVEKVLVSYLTEGKDVSSSYIMTSPSSFFVRMIGPFIAELQ